MYLSRSGYIHEISARRLPWKARESISFYFFILKRDLKSLALISPILDSSTSFYIICEFFTTRTDFFLFLYFFKMLNVLLFRIFSMRVSDKVFPQNVISRIKTVKCTCRFTEMTFISIIAVNIKQLKALFIV